MVAKLQAMRELVKDRQVGDHIVFSCKSCNLGRLGQLLIDMLHLLPPSFRPQ